MTLSAELLFVTNPTALTLHLVDRPCSGDDVLYYFNGPLVFLLPHPELQLLAIAVPEQAGKWPFLVVELTAACIHDVRANRLTLLQAVQGAVGKYLMADFGARVLQLEPLSEIPAEWLPGDVTLAPVQAAHPSLED